MGNKISMENERISLSDEFIEHSNPSFFHTLDFIACHYIFTTNFENMTKLYDKQYCDELVILTGDIINKYYSELEVTHLKERIETGKVTPYKEKIIFSILKFSCIYNKIYRWFIIKKKKVGWLQ